MYSCFQYGNSFLKEVVKQESLERWFLWKQELFYRGKLGGRGQVLDPTCTVYFRNDFTEHPRHVTKK